MALWRGEGCSTDLEPTESIAIWMACGRKALDCIALQRSISPDCDQVRHPTGIGLDHALPLVPDRDATLGIRQVTDVPYHLGYGPACSLGTQSEVELCSHARRGPLGTWEIGSPHVSVHDGIRVVIVLVRPALRDCSLNLRLWASAPSRRGTWGEKLQRLRLRGEPGCILI